MATIKLFRSINKYAKIDPLPPRRTLLRRLAMGFLLALLCACDIGMVIGKSLSGIPFASQSAAKWVPFLLLLTSLLQIKGNLEFLLDGAFQGGDVDRKRTDN